MSTTAIMRPAELAAPVMRRRARSGRYALGRIGLYALAILITLFMLLPIYFIVISAFSPQAKIYAFPKALIPHRSDFSTATFSFFIHSTGVPASVRNSIIVGIGTLILSTVIGPPGWHSPASPSAGAGPSNSLSSPRAPSRRASSLSHSP